MAGQYYRAVTACLRKYRRALTVMAACTLLIAFMRFPFYAPKNHALRMFAPKEAGKTRDLQASTTPSTTTTITDTMRSEKIQLLLPRPLHAINQGESNHNIERNINSAEHLLSEEEVAARFEKRRQILQTACKLYGNSPDFRLRKIRTVPMYRYPPVINVTVGYCPIEKTSSTTWKGIFSSIRKEMKTRQMRAEEIEVPLSQRDVLFAFIREPYGRLLSAYVDKIFSPNTMFWSMTGRFVVQKFRQNASSHSLHCGHDVTFPEFVKYFIHMQTTGEKRNGHYMPIHDQCQMCKYPYKYIGHLETIKKDMPFILRAIQSPVSYDKVYENATIVGNSKMSLKRMRTKVTKCISLDEASRRLWKKWQIRGLIHKSHKFPLREMDTTDISYEKLSQMAIDTLGRSGPRSERVGQKKEAMREAFASVPLEDRLKVQRLLFLDFQMFGFDPQPEEVFPKMPPKPDPKFSSIRREMKWRNMGPEAVDLPVIQLDILFTFVRDPYGRLLSAYVDKIFSPNTFFWTLTGRYVVQKFRKNASSHSLQCGHDVTFPEFIKYFIHMQRTGEMVNAHYIPIHDNCRMCKYPFKYIGHLETFTEDMPFILKAIQSPISYGKVYDSATIEQDSQMSLREMRTEVTKCISLDEASKRMWKKWQIRGVLHKSQSFPLTKMDTKRISAIELKQAAVSALSRSGPRTLRMGQKKEAMREAFASVPLEDRLQVQRLLFLDFQMFGFDPEPDEVFPTTPFKSDPNFSYFDLYRP